jgi:hypothetical protein
MRDGRKGGLGGWWAVWACVSERGVFGRWWWAVWACVNQRGGLKEELEGGGGPFGERGAGGGFGRQWWAVWACVSEAEA